MALFQIEPAPGMKFGLAIAVAFFLSIPLFSVWLLVYDRQSQSHAATSSITQGWGSEQTIDGPVLVVPYRTAAAESPPISGRTDVRPNSSRRELTLAPQVVRVTSDVQPQIRKRSIYEAIVYTARVTGKARFELPTELGANGIDPQQLDFARAQLRFGVTDTAALGPNPHITYKSQSLSLEPSEGGGGGHGFSAFIDASDLTARAVPIEFSFDMRGNGSLSLAPDAGDTVWQVRSTWPSPSFGGAFLPDARRVSEHGFEAVYRIGNLALGRSLIGVNDPPSAVPATTASATAAAQPQSAQISFIQPVDPYSQVNRATKYGFLFIGLTFLGLLMFDIVGGVHVSSIEYLLVGAALVLFFVLLLAFAEVVGFTLAYVLASAAICVLNTAYAAAILASWRRAALIGAELIALYGVLYVLLSLEAYSLLIGSLLLFATLAAVMYATRSIDWGGLGGGRGATS